MTMIEIQSMLTSILLRFSRTGISCIDGNDDLVISLGIDSLDGIKILVEVEETFGISIDDDDLNMKLFSSFNTICNYVFNQCNQKEPRRME